MTLWTLVCLFRVDVDEDRNYLMFDPEAMKTVLESSCVSLKVKQQQHGYRVKPGEPRINQGLLH